MKFVVSVAAAAPSLFLSLVPPRSLAVAASDRMKHEPHPSISFVISQMQPRPPLPAHVAPRRTRSSPMLRKQRREAMVPIFPPTLDPDFITRLDIKHHDLSRRSSEATIELPPRSSSRSSCALSAEMLDDCSFEIVVEPPSPTISYAPSSSTSSFGSSTLVSTPSVRRRRCAKAVVRGALDTVLFSWCGVSHSVRHAEDNLSFDPCT